MKKISEAMTLKITVENKTIVRVIGIALAILAGLLLVYYTRQALVLIMISFFLALALSPPVNYLADKIPKGGRGLATAIAYLATLAIIGLLLSAIVPPLIQQTRQFIDNFPSYIETLSRDGTAAGNFVREYNLVERVQESQAEITSRLSAAGGPLLDVLQRISTSVVALLTVLVLTFFMLVEGPGWLDKFWQLHPKEHKKHREELANKMYRVVTGYVNGQLLIAALSGISTLIMLLILGVPFALPLAAIVSLFGLIPLIGATLGAIVVTTVALFQSLTTAIILAIFFVVYQQIENNVFQPIIQARTVELSPLTILIAAMIGVTLAGILGALLAIPIAASIRILANDYIARHHLTTK